jgi:hypothetical protein
MGENGFELVKDGLTEARWRSAYDAGDSTTDRVVRLFGTENTLHSERLSELCTCFQQRANGPLSYVRMFRGVGSA